MPGWKGNKAPTLKERKKSSSDKTFEIRNEDICSFVKWENMTLEVSTEFGRVAEDGIGVWQGKGLECRYTSSPCSWPAGETGLCTAGQDI